MGGIRNWGKKKRGVNGWGWEEEVVGDIVDRYLFVLFFG